MPEAFQFLASSIPGTEDLLCRELRDLDFSGVRLNKGAIPFRGSRREGWRACLASRIAQRVRVLLARFPAPDEEALYAGIRAVDWQPYITWRQTLSVGAVCRSSAISHSGFAALKAKDAIVDQIRAREGKRPSVSREDPDVRVYLYLVEDRAAVYLDLSGEPLHRRGYRLQTGEAPLRETLAAAILRLSGWDRVSPLVDPLCGSGTIAIEAALWAAGQAPGLSRDRFGFERWADFGREEARAMRELRGELRAAASGNDPRIQASDLDGEVLKAARANARRAGVKISFRRRSLFDLQGDGAAKILVTNPPYGVRLDAGTDFCRRAGAAFSRLHGWRVGLLAGSPEYERAISQKPRLKVPLPNGDLQCDFLIYDIP
ncbi:MAG: THUMP domain-containing protein [Candidatus Erginobacter occultus]|nr:THUMP domain-containing protein [Candidatus Erginobacter occultus]